MAANQFRAEQRFDFVLQILPCHLSILLSGWGGQSAARARASRMTRSHSAVAAASPFSDRTHSAYCSASPCSEASAASFLMSCFVTSCFAVIVDSPIGLTVPGCFLVLR